MRIHPFDKTFKLRILKQIKILESSDKSKTNLLDNCIEKKKDLVNYW